MGESEGLNTQAHSEQPKPRQWISSIHTRLRSLRLLGSACGTSHTSYGRNFGGRENRGGTKSTLIWQLGCQQTDAGTSSFRRNLGGVTPELLRKLLRTRSTSLHCHFGNACARQGHGFGKWTLPVFQTEFQGRAGWQPSTRSEYRLSDLESRPLRARIVEQ